MFAESGKEEKGPTRVEALRGKILYASSTERRNEIRKIKGLAADEQKLLIPDVIKLCTEDLDPNVRETSIRILTEMKTQEAEKAFLTALKDKVDDVQLAGISGLREIRSKAAGPPLVELLKTLDAKKEQTKYSSIMRALGALHHKTDSAPLIKTAEEADTHEEIRRSIILYLGDVKAQDGYEFLIKLARNEEKEPDLRAYAVNSIGRMKEARAVPDLKQILETIRNQKSPKERARMSRLRFQSMVALMRLGDRSMVPEVMSAARDDDPVVRLRAVRQLGEMRTPEAKELLEFKSKYDENARVKKAAKLALDEWDKAPGDTGSDLDDSDKEK